MMKIQVSLCCLIPASLGIIISTKFTFIVITFCHETTITAISWLPPWISQLFSHGTFCMGLHLFTGRLFLSMHHFWTVTGWFDCSRAVFLVTLLLEYFGECTIGVTVLLEYLDCAFLLCSCFLFCNLLIFIQFFLPLQKAF